MKGEDVMLVFFVCTIILIIMLAGKESKTKPFDPCQEHFNANTKNTTLYKQKNIPHKGIKPARVVIECEVKL